MKKITSLLAAICFILSSVFSFSVFAENETENIIDYGMENAPVQLTKIAYASLMSSENIIAVNHDNTIDDIVAMSRKYPHSGFSYRETRYEQVPKLTAPYKAGSLNQSDIDDATNAMKMVRFLAGVPYENTKFLPELNNIAQHGSVLLAASDQFSHYPYKPDDMSDDFYEIAYRGCREANIFWGINNISYGVLGWVYDDGDNNIERAGHRRWILNPGNQNFGIGYAEGKSNMHVFDGMGPWDCESDSYISWPAAGDFPIQYFAASEYVSDTIVAPWSINLGAPYSEPDKNDIVLKLTRKRDGKVWIFNKNTPNLAEEGLSNRKLHLSVNGDGYGINKAIIFRPDLDSLGTIRDGDIFTIELSGIKNTDGSPASLSYDINFFDLDDALTKSKVTINVEHNGSPVQNATVNIDGQTINTDSNGKASVRVKNNKNYNYTVQKLGYNTETGSIRVGEGAVTQNVSMTIPVTFTIKDTSKSYDATSQGVSIVATPNVSYTVKYDGSETMPTNAGTYNVTVEANAAGYAGSATGKLTISKAAISIKADDKGKKIGNADPSLTYTITSGQLYGDDQFTGKLSRKNGESIGTYQITQGNLKLSDNYSISFTPATFTILDKIPQNIKVSEITEKTYGDSNFKLEVTPDPESKLNNFTYESDNTSVAEISSDGTVTIKGAGTANITVKQAGNEDYAAFTKTQKLTVNKVKLSVTADAKVKKIGTEDPELTYTYTGSLVGSDSFKGNLTRRSGEDIGIYDILQGTLAVNDNYVISYNKANFEIVEKTPQNITVSKIAEKTYGDSDFKIEVMPDVDSNLTDFTYESDNTDIAEISADGTVTIKAAGKANIIVRQAGNEEYAAFNNTQELVVNKKPIALTGINLDEKTAVLGDVLAGDEKTVTLDFDKINVTIIEEIDEENVKVSATNLELTGDKAANYELSTESIESTVKIDGIVTVDIVADNGTVTGVGKYLKGANVTLTVTANSGYNFSGWYVEDVVVSTNSTYSFVADSDISVTAKFKRRSSGGGGISSYTVKFDTNGGSELKNISVRKGQTIGSISEPIKEGYVFTGWYSDKELTKPHSADEKVNASTTLYAGWKIDPVRQLVLTIGKKEATVWNEEKSNDVAPIIRNDRTMLPARFVAENLGATVEWFGEEQKVLITKDNVKIEIYIDSDKAYVNGEEVILDSPAFIENDRTYTPIRFIAESLGAEVDWNEETKEVIITK